MTIGENNDLTHQIKVCKICADRFYNTATAHEPRPVVWYRSSSRLLIAGQAPGLRVYEAGRPFADPSGVRLRAWLGLEEDTFYDLSRVAVVPMAFCFPGYDAKGSDLPPPPVCAKTWHPKVMNELTNVKLRILVGGHAHRWHLKVKSGVTETVKNWRAYAPDVFALPHPSWRNTGWLKKNPWFEEELLPELRLRVRAVMEL